MENTDIMKIALAIIVGIVSAFSKVIFDKIFSAYNPDPKKINSEIKKCLNFIFSYILPILALILLYLKYDKIDKLLILSTAVLCSVFIFNVLYDIFNRFLDLLLLKKEKSIIAEIISVLGKNIEVTEGQNEALIKLTKAQEDHLNLTNELIQYSKKSETE
jgi:hypothetical protein